LKLKIIELEKSIDPLTRKVDILDGELTREQEANNQVIKDLNDQVEIAETKSNNVQHQLEETLK
jgi:hypothetical protein